MRQVWKTVVTFLAVALFVVPLLAGCASSAGPAAPPVAPTKAPEAPKVEPTKPAAAPAQAAAPAPTSAPAQAAAPAPAKPSGEPIVIGYFNALSGSGSGMGVPQRDMTQILDEKVNAEGGINGRPLKIIYYDDESNESKGVLVMKKLIEQDKVLGIIGTVMSGIAMATAPIAEDAKVPTIFLNSSRAYLQPPKKYIFKLPTSETFYCEALFSYLKDQKLTKLALLNQNAGLGKEAQKYIDANAAKNGVKIVDEESYDPNGTDSLPQLTKIKAANPEALLVYGAEPAGAIAIRQAKELGIKVPIISVESIVTPAIMNVKELREGMEGVVISGHKPDVYKQLPDTDPQKKVIAAMDAAVQKKHNRPGGYWEANGNDAAMIMFDALKRANVDPTKVEESREKIRNAIEATDNFVGAANIVSYSPTDHEKILTATLAITKVENGQLKLVKTFN